jgi:hypothetical protein
MLVNVHTQSSLASVTASGDNFNEIYARVSHSSNRAFQKHHSANRIKLSAEDVNPTPPFVMDLLSLIANEICIL